MSDTTMPRELFSRYVSGDITLTEIATLETALRNDAELRKAFISYLNIDSALGDLAALSDTELKEVEQAVTGATNNETAPTSKKSRARSNSRFLSSPTALAASLLVMAIVWAYWQSSSKVVPLATMVNEVDAVLMLDGKPWSSHDHLAGNYQLDQGLMHLRFGGGVMIYIEAPARWKAVSEKRLVLYDGRISANVPPDGVGFTVETPEAEIVDFGTEFSVDVGGGASEVHVFKGLVRVQPRLKKNEKLTEAIDLKSSQAVKIEEVSPSPISIALAKNRFIRTFEEAKRKYPRTIKQQAPVAYYRMAIRDQGLTSIPPKYSGDVLTGNGIRPPHASGVFAGGSLRVLANSTGRGGRVDNPPPFENGQFTLATYLYLESETPSATAVTNLHSDEGNFTLALDDRGFLKVTVRSTEGQLTSASGADPLPVHDWRHIVVTIDGKSLRMYDAGKLIGSTSCKPMSPSKMAPLWFGRDAGGASLWNGRIDEVAIFDRALTEDEIAALYQAGLDEMNGQP